MRHLLTLAPMLVLLIAAAVVDVRTRRIPNALNGLLLLTGLASTTFYGSGLTLGQSLAGMSAGFGLTFVLFAINAMGGGDVKLFSALGAWLGAPRVTEVFAAAAIVGMLVVLGQAARDGRLRALFRSSTVIALNAVSGDLSAPPEEPRESGRKRLPYAVPTLIAVLIVQAVHLWR